MTAQTRYIVFDVESVVDGELLSRVAYPSRQLGPAEAIAAWCDEKKDPDAFIPVSFHRPVAIAVARVSADFRLLDLRSLDAPRFDSRVMVELFWKGVDFYRGAVLVDFNGRGFDLPLLTLAAFREGLSCPTYFRDADRYGFRYRFTEKHIDLMEWMTEYGGFRLAGGLNVLAKMIGCPGKLDVDGAGVAELHARGALSEINEYCLQDVLDTYFVFLRTRVLTGEIDPAQEAEARSDAEAWIEENGEHSPALRRYLEALRGG